MNEKKKKSKKKIVIIAAVVIGVLVVIVGGITVISNISKGMQEAMNMMAGENEALFEVTKEDVKQEISTSGIVVGVEKDAYVSPVTAKVENICVEPGQTVKKGDILLTYDASELGDDLEKVKIQAQSERAAGNESFEMANEAASKVSAAKKKVKKIKEEIKKLKKEISKLSKKVAGYEEKINAATEEAPADIDEKAYKKAVSDLKKKNESLASKEGQLAEQEGIIATNKDIKVSASTKAQVSASNQLSDMNINDAQESLDAAEAGIVAEEDGIVASVDVVKGAYASETQTVMTIIKSDKIGVEFTIPKDDIGSISKGQKVRAVISGQEYSGTVDFVSRVANSSLPASDNGTDIGGNIKGRVSIDNPDENIFIGVKAKAFIFVGESKQSLVIPFEALNMDIDGDFVYVVNKENLIERKNVTVGIYSDEYYEVLDGLSEGDKVIREVTKDMKPGDEYVGNAMPGMAMPE